MLSEDLIKIFERDLNQLIKEIELYKNEQNLWTLDKDIKNSAGNLCLHLIDNLNHFIGAQLGNTGYIRKRELEFSLKNIPVAKLKEEIELTKELIKEGLSKLKNDDLINEYPINVFGASMSTQYFLVHLTTHLAYHLGQINYHRRLLET